MTSSFYDCTDKDMDGKDVSMSTFTNKLYDNYGNRGFHVLAFPCNQFANEEPGTEKEIMNFVQSNYDSEMSSKLTFFEKADVNGPRAREVYKYLKTTLPNKDGTKDISWNFEKFLINHKGIPFMRYAPNTPPLNIEADINELLNQKEREDANAEDTKGEEKDKEEDKKRDAEEVKEDSAESESNKKQKAVEDAA